MLITVVILLCRLGLNRGAQRRGEWSIRNFQGFGVKVIRAREGGGGRKGEYPVPVKISFGTVHSSVRFRG
jgi:hypothetical protein